MTGTPIRNADGEYIGIDYHYGDEHEYDENPYDIDPGDIGEFDGCCARGDWNGHRCQPDSAVIYVPIVQVSRLWGTSVYFDETQTADYLWECTYCGTIGTADVLNGGK